MTEVLLKPENASLASSTPVTYRMPIAERNTKSALSFVNNIVVNMPSTVTMVIQAWMLKPANTKSSMIQNVVLLRCKDMKFVINPQIYKKKNADNFIRNFNRPPKR
jgi:hypothetical protein